ncbi:hypothetical protein LWI29_030098 [Acer saccharum]|uniref:Uncharacterized protein n=1 Tax=Acer saccharum TaxID=4024 RepID=A0AA39WA37_ACESA|nr:hypothetical protein LWI29_030098 [Acer saccharum]
MKHSTWMKDPYDLMGDEVHRVAKMVTLLLDDRCAFALFTESTLLKRGIIYGLPNGRPRLFYNEPICGELTRTTKNQIERKKVVHNDSKSSAKVRTPSKKKQRSSRSGVATPSKANGLPSKLATFEKGEEKKKRKRSSSVFLASSGHVGLVTSVIDSLRSEDEKEGKGNDLVFLALGEHQAKKRKSENVPSEGLVPSTSLRIGHATAPSSPRDKVDEGLGLI